MLDYSEMYRNQYIKIFVVRPSVCDGCGSGRNKFLGHMQNPHVRFSFHRNIITYFS